MNSRFFIGFRISPALALMLLGVCLFGGALSGMAQQDASQPSTAVPTGWVEQKITDAEQSQQIITPEYIVGEGDVLRISIWKEQEVSQPSITVRPDGMISLPLLGVVKVSGMTVPQIQDVLAEKLSRFMTKPSVTVTVLQMRSKIVLVTGEVKKPGAYALVKPTSVMELIIRAGGPTIYAHRRSVLVLRTVDGKMQKYRVNYKQLLRGNDPEQNIELKPGDTVVIP